jgi:hypothetical protein
MAVKPWSGRNSFFQTRCKTIEDQLNGTRPCNIRENQPKNIFRTFSVPRQLFSLILRLTIHGCLLITRWKTPKSRNSDELQRFRLLEVACHGASR